MELIERKYHKVLELIERKYHKLLEMIPQVVVMQKVPQGLIYS